MEYSLITMITILVSALGITLQVFFFSPVSPNLLQLPPAPPLFAQNNKLQRVIKLGEGLLQKPEDVSIDQKGILYTATRDGWIKRLHKNGTVENWKKIHDRGTLVGSTITKNGDLIVCDTEEALIKVDKNRKVTILTTHLNGERIKFANDVVEASDGSLYFSVSSTKYRPEEYHLDILEGKPHGQLLKYDPSTKETSLVLDGLGFANGVDISLDQEFLVVCETWKFRCLKYWLKEQKRGDVEIFIDNLPGAPDNIKPAPDGTFWIALLQLTSSTLKFVRSSKAIRHILVMSPPELFEQFTGISRGATVINVGSDQRIIKRLDDPNGKVLTFVTSALEFEGNLYLGNFKKNFIGKLPLKCLV